MLCPRLREDIEVAQSRIGRRMVAHLGLSWYSIDSNAGNGARNVRQSMIRRAARLDGKHQAFGSPIRDVGSTGGATLRFRRETFHTCGFSELVSLQRRAPKLDQVTVTLAPPNSFRKSGARLSCGEKKRNRDKKPGTSFHDGHSTILSVNMIQVMISSAPTAAVRMAGFA